MKHGMEGWGQMNLTIENLNRMRHMDIMELDREQLADIEDIKIDTGKSVESRVRSFMEQAGNPFALNVGEYILQFGYMEDTEETLDDRMALLVRRMAQVTV